MGVVNNNNKKASVALDRRHRGVAEPLWFLPGSTLSVCCVWVYQAGRKVGSPRLHLFFFFPLSLYLFSVIFKKIFLRRPGWNRRVAEAPWRRASWFETPVAPVSTDRCSSLPPKLPSSHRAVRTSRDSGLGTVAMKVTVTFGDTAVVVPCKAGWTVRDLMEQATRRYRRILEQVTKTASRYVTRQFHVIVFEWKKKKVCLHSAHSSNLTGLVSHVTRAVMTLIIPTYILLRWAKLLFCCLNMSKVLFTELYRLSFPARRCFHTIMVEK